MTETLDLSALPQPAVVEEVTYDALLARKLADLQARDPAFTALLPSDPAVKLLEVDAYDELLVRQRINDAARARLLAFATGSDLDELAAFYDVPRLDGEGDTSLRARVRERIKGSSAAGGAAHYRYHAMSASNRVRDVAVDAPAGGVVRVSVLGRDGDGTPDAAVLDAVRARVADEAVRVLCHDVQVVPAAIKVVDVVADVTLLPNTPAAVLDGLPGALRVAVENARGLGWDLTLSWLTARLQAGGVYRVQVAQPLADVVCDRNECVALGAVTIRNAGRAE